MTHPHFSFELLATDRQARRGVVHTAHGDIPTPVFMPVGTAGTVKTLTVTQLEQDIDARIILGNSYHLYLRPGLEILEKAGGLHRFMGWNRAILTDSGGFQVFSLAKLRSLGDDGVVFQSHIDGSKHTFTPESVAHIQAVIGSDIAMCLDDCPALPATPERLDASLKRSTHWAQRTLECPRPAHQARFAIVQGGLDVERRLAHLAELTALPFEGYALGGLSVGETPPEMHALCREVVPSMPVERPRYLMGVGTPWDLVESVSAGMDMFDCVLPTRTARMGTAYVGTGQKVVITNAKYRDDLRPLDENCDCLACRTVSRAYLRHLFVAKEVTGLVLMSLHNLRYYARLMAQIRASIEEGSFQALRARYQPDAVAEEAE
jgi:queuine tRNA-ribosyltransferase